MAKKDSRSAEDRLKSIEAKLQEYYGKVDTNSANAALQIILYAKPVDDPLAIFAKMHPIATAEMWQYEIIKNGTPYDATRFAEKTKGAYITGLQNVVLDRGDGRDIYQFAYRVERADLHKLRTRMSQLRDMGDKDADGYLTQIDSLIAKRSAATNTNQTDPSSGQRSHPKPF